MHFCFSFERQALKPRPSRGAHARLARERQDVIRIEALSARDAREVDALLDAAFGPDRTERTAYRIRAGAHMLDSLSYAAVDSAGALLGTLQSWPVALHDVQGNCHPLVMVGPVAVWPDHQSAGIGKMLMQIAVRDAYAMRTDPLMMIGDPEYYGRFWGFSSAGTTHWGVPGPVDRHRLLALSVDGSPLPDSGMLGPRRKPDAQAA